MVFEPGKFKVETRQSKTQINISCDWADIHHLDKTEIPPILIASFDIEADSSHGDFPIPKKDCKKLTNQLAISWIKNVKIVEQGDCGASDIVIGVDPRPDIKYDSVEGGQELTTVYGTGPNGEVTSEQIVIDTRTFR